MKEVKDTVEPEKVVVVEDSVIADSVKFSVKLRAPDPPIQVPAPLVEPVTEHAALPLVRLPVLAIVASPPIVMPLLFVASVKLAPDCTVRSLLKFSADPATVTDAPLPTTSFPICVAVVTVFPVPLIVISEFPGVPNVPLIERFPPTLIVSATVFVTLPLDVKSPLTVHPEPPAVVKEIDPPFVTLPAFTTLAPLDTRLPPDDIVNVLPVASIVPLVTFTAPVVTVGFVTVSVFPPTFTVAPDPFSKSPATAFENVAAPPSVSTSPAPSVCPTAVVIPLTVSAFPFRSTATPLSVNVPLSASSVTTPTELNTFSSPVLFSVVPLPMISAHVPAPAVEFRFVVPAFVYPPLTVRLVALPPPSVKLSPVSTARLPNVPTPTRLTPPVPLISTDPNVFPFGVTTCATLPFRTNVLDPTCASVPRLRFPPTLKVPAALEPSHVPLTVRSLPTLGLCPFWYTVPLTVTLL